MKFNKELLKKQKENEESLKERIGKLGRVVDVFQDGDGWADGFKMTYFVIRDYAGGTYRVIKGNDDNTEAYERCDSGGWGLLQI